MHNLRESGFSDMKQEHPFDGQELGCFRWDGYVYSYELLRGVHRELVDGCAFTEIYARWRDLLWRQDKSIKLPSRQRFTFAVFAFIALLRLDYKRGFGFGACQVCSQSTADLSLSLDGTTIGVPRGFTGLNPFAASSRVLPSLDPLSNRIYVSGAAYRLQLRSFSNLSVNARTLLAHEIGVKRDALGKFLTCLVNVDCSHLVTELLRDLGSFSPLQALLPLSAVELVREFVSLSRARRDTSPIASQLAQQCRTLACALQDASLKADARAALFALVLDMAENVVSYSSAQSSLPVSAGSRFIAPKRNSVGTLRGGLWTANLDDLHEVCRYEIDSIPAKTYMDGDDFCRKCTSSLKKLSEGIINAYCQHGVCLGFGIMLESESPRLAMHLLMSIGGDGRRMNVFYDNGCHLQTFVLRREPALYAQCRFFIDRFHLAGHSGCASELNPNLYPALAGTNTMVCEQAHRALQVFRKPLSGMYQFRAMFILRHVLYLRNLSKGGFEVRQLSPP